MDNNSINGQIYKYIGKEKGSLTTGNNPQQNITEGLGDSSFTSSNSTEYSKLINSSKQKKKFNAMPNFVKYIVRGMEQ